MTLILVSNILMITLAQMDVPLSDESTTQLSGDSLFATLFFTCNTEGWLCPPPGERDGMEGGMSVAQWGGSSAEPV